MAIYHLHTKHITRSKGHSAVAAASYRSGEILHDEREEHTHDYTRKQNIHYTEIIAPADAPQWATERQALWNGAEAMERRKDSRVAREIEVSLPRELNLEQNIELVREFVTDNLVDKGMIADIAIHETKAGDGGTNPHAHILLTTREINAEGFAAKKNTNWDKVQSLETWREEWANTVNTHLENAEFEEEIDHRSFEDRGIEQTPTVHMGKTATTMEKQGVTSDRGQENLEIRHFNRVMEYARATVGYVVENSMEFYHQLKERLYFSEYALEEAEIKNVEIVGYAEPYQSHDFEREKEYER